MCRTRCDTRPVGADGDSLAGRAACHAAAVDLYWLPLGAGGHSVRLNGRAYEGVAARLQGRPACDLYHSALQVEIPAAKYVIEQAPVHDWSGKDRGVVAEGAVGTSWAGRFRIFR
jgi:N-formylglutamate amidohydrolase